MTKMSSRMVARMIMLRGVGYTQKRIAEDLGVSPGTICYHMKRLRKLVAINGPQDVFEYYIKRYSNWRVVE